MASNQFICPSCRCTSFTVFATDMSAVEVTCAYCGYSCEDSDLRKHVDALKGEAEQVPNGFTIIRKIKTRAD